MKLSLEVLAAGKMQGKTIPVPLGEFVIGRDPECQLRPSSPLISKRHCALVVRGGMVFVRDFGSTNGTFINDRQLKGEIEVQNGDCLKAGPLAFRITIDTGTPVDQPTPLPPLKVPPSSEDEDAAAVLLSVQDDGGPAPGSPGVDSAGVPMGSTVMDVQSPSNPEASPSAEAGKPADSPSRPATAKSGDTSSAAKTILEKYWRRPRT
jgi:pSer/pThr/pTyr-binding forkhead associated (FHA) protein